MEGIATSTAVSTSEIEAMLENFKRENGVGACFRELLTEIAIDFFTLAEECNEDAWELLFDAWRHSRQ